MKKSIKFLAIVGVVMSLNAESISFSDSVRVVKSEPVYRTVTKKVPYQECWDEQVPVYSNNGGDGTLGALIGGVAGGIIGNQVGRGGGKTAATVGGAIIGTLVGKNLSKSDSQPNGTAYKTQRRCVTKYTESQEEKFVGYKNMANYKGKTIIKYSDTPLKVIHLNVTVVY